MTRQEIVNKYLGIKYVNMGRDLSGLDCYGLLMCIYKDFGYDLIDADFKYDKKWQYKGHNYIAENYAKQWDRVDKPKFLDVILFKN